MEKKLMRVWLNHFGHFYRNRSVPAGWGKAHAERPLSIIKYRGLRILLRSLAKRLHHPEKYFGFPRQNFALSWKNVAFSQEPFVCCYVKLLCSLNKIVLSLTKLLCSPEKFLNSLTKHLPSSETLLHCPMKWLSHLRNVCIFPQWKVSWEIAELAMC